MAPTKIQEPFIYFILRNNKPLESCFPTIIPKFQYLPRFCLCLLCGNPTRVALFACKISTNQTKLEHEWCEPNLNSESQVLSCCGVLVRKGAGDCIARRDEPDAFKAPLFETQLKQKNVFLCLKTDSRCAPEISNYEKVFKLIFLSVSGMSRSSKLFTVELLLCVLKL